jgi:CRISPR-associated protein Csb2
LVLQARFLAGTYGGLEWPPSPFRLLQAMVAGLSTADHEGLRWFEAQHAPDILAEPEPAQLRLKQSVPNNADPSKTQSVFTLRQVVHRQISQPVRYFYALREETSQSAIEAAMQAAHAVHTLGTGQDMCSIEVAVADIAPDSSSQLQWWQPAPSAGMARLAGDRVLRVPVVGSLQALQARFIAFQQRLEAADQGYGRPVQAAAKHQLTTYRSSAEQARWVIVPLRFVKPGQPGKLARFHPENAVVVAGMLRHAAMGLAGDGPLADFAAGYATAADKDQRMSWLPLPSVGHAHADGMVRRGLFVARARDIEHFSALVADLPDAGLPLVDEETGECLALAQPVPMEEEPVVGQYLSASADWCSVTPMVMPGDYAGTPRLLNRLLLKALREAGVDPGLLAQAEFSKQGFGRHAVRIRELRLKNWTAKHLVLEHVRLRFTQPIRGPLVLGRGRHYGLGLFCANPE